jgi:hypothetical protein
MVALRPLRARERGPRAPAALPKKASMMSLKGNPAPNPPAPAAAPAPPNGSPPRSYIWRLLASDSTS